MRKIAPILLFVCATVWAQSEPVPVEPTHSFSSTTAAQTTPSSTAPGLAEQGTSASKAPEYKLDPLTVSNVVYPLQSREEKIEGEVVASFWVSNTGETMSVHAFKGDPVLAKAVEETVSKWTFKPVIRDGKAVTVNATASFRFVLSDEDQGINGVAPDISPARQAQRVRVSPGVTAGLLVYKVQPAYPADARQARIQGTVVLKALINKEGGIADLRLISGPEELAPAAISAVKQWRYRPYMLAGNPVEVETQIQVNFQLR